MSLPCKCVQAAIGFWVFNSSLFLFAFAFVRLHNYLFTTFPKSIIFFSFLILRHYSGVFFLETLIIFLIDYSSLFLLTSHIFPIHLNLAAKIIYLSMSILAFLFCISKAYQTSTLAYMSVLLFPSCFWPVHNLFCFKSVKQLPASDLHSVHKYKFCLMNLCVWIKRLLSVFAN